MFGKRRGLVPYRVDSSATPIATPSRWRDRIRILVAETAAVVAFTVIVVGAVMLASPLGEPFANFIDRLAGVAH